MDRHHIWGTVTCADIAKLMKGDVVQELENKLRYLLTKKGNDKSEDLVFSCFSCVHPVCSSCVFIVCVHPVFSSCVFILCFHPVCSSCVFILCFHPVFSSCVFVLCFHPMFSCFHPVFSSFHVFIFSSFHRPRSDYIFFLSLDTSALATDGMSHWLVDIALSLDRSRIKIYARDPESSTGESPFNTVDI